MALHVLRSFLLRLQVITLAHTPVSKDDQVTIAMDAAGFDEPGLARPAVRGGRFVVETHRVVVKPRVFSFGVIGIVQQFLDRRTYPSLMGRSEGTQSRDPSVRKGYPSRIRVTSFDLWPIAVALDIQVGRDIKATEVGNTLHLLRTRTHPGVNRDQHRPENKNDDNYNCQFQEGECAARWSNRFPPRHFPAAQSRRQTA